MIVNAGRSGQDVDFSPLLHRFLGLKRGISSFVSQTRYRQRKLLRRSFVWASSPRRFYVTARVSQQLVAGTVI
jgi:hypothetical protein